MPEDRLVDEYDVRRWFITADLEQALDTFRVVTGILETRSAVQPKRKRRKDAGVSRSKDDNLPLIGNLGGRE